MLQHEYSGAQPQTLLGIVMSDPIDDLLNQLKSSDIKAASASLHMPMTSPPSGLPSDSIDDLLANLDGKAASPDQPRTGLSSPAQASQQQAKQQQKLTPQVPLQPSKNPQFDALVNPPATAPPSPDAEASTDRLLAEIKTLYTEQDQAEGLKRQQQLQAEQNRQAHLNRQKQAAIVRQAEAWLKDLNHQSSEAAWFEEFAAKYASRVEAAIDYLGLQAE